MNIDALKEEVWGQLQKIRIEKDMDGEFLLLNRDLYEEIRRDPALRHTFVHKYEQKDITVGDTFMGLRVRVDERDSRLCKVT